MPPPVILKPQLEWIGPYHTKAELIAAMEKKVLRVPGNNYEFSLQIQMHFKEIISGVRADVAVKVFGGDVDMLFELAEQIEKIIDIVLGDSDVRVGQVTGLPVLSIQIDREKMARYGLNVTDIQDVVAIAVEERSAGLIFEDDCRSDL